LPVEDWILIFATLGKQEDTGLSVGGLFVGVNDNVGIVDEVGDVEGAPTQEIPVLLQEKHILTPLSSKVERVMISNRHTTLPLETYSSFHNTCRQCCCWQGRVRCISSSY
jgi:hypothetical protein